MFDTVIRKTTGSKVKNNVVSWKSEELPGLRLNWAKVFTGVILLLAGFGWRVLQDNHSAIFGRWSFGGTFLLVILVAMLAWLIANYRFVDNKLQLMVSCITFGVALTVLVIYLAKGQPGNVWLAALSVLLVIAVLLALLALNGLTTWWPHGRRSKNRGEG